MSYHMIETTRPVEVGCSVVNVDCKSHTNTANENNRLPDWWYKDKTLENKTLEDTDWYIQFSNRQQQRQQQDKVKILPIEVGIKQNQIHRWKSRPQSWRSWFFQHGRSSNCRGHGWCICMALIIIARQSLRLKQKVIAREEESLSYVYQIVDTLKVPPKTKVVAMITTWAVTYESTTTTEITVDMTHVLPVHYWTMVSRRLGGIFTSIGVLTAHDLFGEEEGPD